MSPQPDILNDVLGPVMVGPSSSHTAAPACIGRMVTDICGGVRRAEILYSRTGSYAATLRGQASDRGFAAGLLGLACDDADLPRALDLARARGLGIVFSAVPEDFDHPNRAIIRAVGEDGISHEIASLSVGGGHILITAIDGAPVEIDGRRDLSIRFEGGVEVGEPRLVRGGRLLRRVTPVASDPSRRPPFDSARLLENARPPEDALAEAALAYEGALSGWDEERLLARLDRVLTVMDAAAHGGLALRSSPHFRYLKPSAAGMAARRADFVPSGILEEGIVIATAVMEHNRNMGVIVAAPTAGSAGVLPAVLLPLLRAGRIPRRAALRALAAAGLVGALVLARATFAAEEAGCQAENGTASAMAAAALCDLRGAPARIALRAAALALSNQLGLVCDPVGGGVEIPCIARNAAAAAGAVAAANMALGGFDPLVPLDEVAAAMAAIGREMPASLRCTARGGLAATPTAVAASSPRTEGARR